jgi:hypothetical protein
MNQHRSMKKYVIYGLAAATTLLLAGCATPFEKVYYSAGENFSTPGGYNRSIISSTNF